ncbi:MAG: MATE family efflux transporter [Lachnospiraceae bacterium]|jgi:putative MATE family efflux protein
MKKNLNMITGSPFRSLLAFALPMVLGNLFQQLYQIVDSIIVGKVLGQKALSAVGSTFSICHLYVGIALGLGTGCMIVFSQLLGARRFVRMKTAFYTAIITFALLSIAALVIGLVSTEGILQLTNIPEEIYPDARIYYRLYVLGFPALFVYNIASSVFNSLGKSKITLFLLMGTSLLNVALDLWFVIGLGQGVAGAAIATDISLYVAAIVAIILVLVHVKKNYKTEERADIFEFRILGNMLKVAIPTMIVQIVVSVGYVALQSLVNTFGIDIISGYVAGYKIDALCAIPMVQIGNAMATYTGQNVGANQYDRVYKGLKVASATVAVIFAVFASIIWLFGRQMIGLFMDANAGAAAYDAGVGYMRVMCSTYILLGLMYIFAATLRGAGDAIMSVLAVILNFGTRVAFAYIMVHITGSELAIWWSNPIGWMVALVICGLRFKSGAWKTKRLADRV